MLSNSLVAGADIPTRITLLNHDQRDVAVVCVLKSRLIECLFDRATPGEPIFPSSLFGHPILPTMKGERPMVARVLNRVQSLWEFGEDMRLALVQVDTTLSERYLQSKTSSG